uniref:SCP domain-containing protein n=1 Tax=Parascaris univalens TaxID=6257 RepID=A0A915C752_PARUN
MELHFAHIQFVPWGIALKKRLRSLSGWVAEMASSKGEAFFCYGSEQAWGVTTKIGCGIRNCIEGGWKTTFVVCNYLVAV